jgi:hypothetical protein
MQAGNSKHNDDALIHCNYVFSVAAAAPSDDSSGGNNALRLLAAGKLIVGSVVYDFSTRSAQCRHIQQAGRALLTSLLFGEGKLDSLYITFSSSGAGSMELVSMACPSVVRGRIIIMKYIT